MDKCVIREWKIDDAANLAEMLNNKNILDNHRCFRCDNIHFRTAEMGYYIGEPYWGKCIL